MGNDNYLANGHFDFGYVLNFFGSRQGLSS